MRYRLVCISLKWLYEKLQQRPIFLWLRKPTCVQLIHKKFLGRKNKPKTVFNHKNKLRLIRWAGNWRMFKWKFEHSNFMCLDMYMFQMKISYSDSIVKVNFKHMSFWMANEHYFEGKLKRLNMGKRSVPDKIRWAVGKDKQEAVFHSILVFVQNTLFSPICTTLAQMDANFKMSYWGYM